MRRRVDQTRVLLWSGSRDYLVPKQLNDNNVDAQKQIGTPVCVREYVLMVFRFRQPLQHSTTELEGNRSRQTKLVAVNMDIEVGNQNIWGLTQLSTIYGLSCQCRYQIQAPSLERQNHSQIMNDESPWVYAGETSAATGANNFPPVWREPRN